MYFDRLARNYQRRHILKAVFYHLPSHLFKTHHLGFVWRRDPRVSRGSNNIPLWLASRPHLREKLLFYKYITVTQFPSKGLKRRRAADAINQIYHMTPCSSVLPDGFGKIRKKYIAQNQKRSYATVLAIILWILDDALRNASLVLRGNIQSSHTQQVHPLEEWILRLNLNVQFFLNENLIGFFYNAS